LLVRFQNLDTERVDDDVLARRQKRNDDRHHCGRPRIDARIGEAERKDGDGEARLDQQRPRTATAQTARKSAQRQPVDDRRPQEFERIGRADKGKNADRGAAHARFGKPKRQRAERQRQRQTRRETHEKNGKQTRPV